MFAIKKPSRLGQWTGRRRSSRSEEPVLPHLWRRPVLLRLAVVLVTALAASALGYWVGPSQSFRSAEVFGYEIRSRIAFGVVNQALTDRRRDEAAEAAADRGENEIQAAHRAVAPVLDRYPAGALLVPRPAHHRGSAAAAP